MGELVRQYSDVMVSSIVVLSLMGAIACLYIKYYEFFNCVIEALNYR